MENKNVDLKRNQTKLVKMKHVNHDLYPISRVQKRHSYAPGQHILFIGLYSLWPRVKGDETCWKAIIY